MDQTPLEFCFNTKGATYAICMLLPGTTSKIQPLDVVVNSKFKAIVDKLCTEYMSKNLDAFLKGNVTASDRRVLFTKWVGLAWKDVCRDLEETVVCSFFKCGITIPIDGSRDSKINIEGLPNYEVVKSHNVEDIEFYSSASESEAFLRLLSE